MLLLLQYVTINLGLDPDPDSVNSFIKIPDPVYIFCELGNIFWVNNTSILCRLTQILFSTWHQNFFLSFFCCCWIPGLGSEIKVSEWKKRSGSGIKILNQQQCQSKSLSTVQCSGSMTFWCGSGSADPCLWLMDPDADPYPSIFVIDLQDANKKLIFLKFFCIILFEGTFTSFFKDKTSKRSHKTAEIKVFLAIFA